MRSSLPDGDLSRVIDIAVTEKLERLDRVVWLEGFGTVGEKCRRIEALATALAGELMSDAD